jgi:hypothetical protein
MPEIGVSFPGEPLAGKDAVGLRSWVMDASHSKRWQVHRAPAHPDGRNYQSLRDDIRTGDLLLFRGKHFLSGMIEKLSSSPYSHVAILAKWHGRVLAFQADLRGVEVLPASRIVYQYDGGVDWWALKPEWRENGKFREDLLFDTALTLLGIKYGYWSLLGLALRIMLGRTLNPKDAKATPDSLFCSQFVSLCYRTASHKRMDVNRLVNDAATSPGDFAHSGFFEPRCALYDGSGGQAGVVNVLDEPLHANGNRRGRRKRNSVITWTGQGSIDPRLLAPPNGAPPPANG